MMQCVFTILEPGKEARDLAVRAGMTFGRGPDNDCILSDNTVGAQHFRVSELTGELTVDDLGSTNSTKFEGGRILGTGQRQPLKQGLVFWAGETRIVVKELEQPVATSGQDVQTPEEPPETTDEDETIRASGGVPAGGNSGGRDVGEPVATFREPEVAPSPPVPPPVNEGGPVKNQPGPATPTEEGTKDFDLNAARIEKALRKLRPRLVVASAGMQKIVDISSPEFSIGRAETADLTLNHPHLSGTHAKLHFDGDKFFLEDFESRNRSYVDGSVLDPKEKREVCPEARLTFGSIETLLVMDGQDSSYAKQKRAAKILLKEKKISRAEWRDARRHAEDERRHVGEILLRDCRLEVTDWVDAEQRAGESRRTPAQLLVWIVVSILAVAIVLWTTRFLWS